ncbi:MAG TPA: hypothetical protein VGM11_05040 [Acidobacteriaceae bacterium]|jgi:hypothetical protein
MLFTATHKRAVILSDPERSEGESKDRRITPGSPLLRMPHVSPLRRGFADRRVLLLLALALLLTAAAAHAQGCTQCLDTTRATPPAVQAGYRHAIELLAGAASALFLAGLLLLRRNP